MTTDLHPLQTWLRPQPLSLGCNNIAELFFFNSFIFGLNLFIFGCAESSLLCGLFSPFGKRGLHLVVVRRLLIVVTSLISEHGL